MRTVLVFLVAALIGLPATPALAQSPATTLRVASVTPAPDQPQATDQAVIFYEDFDQLPDWRSRYFEYVPEKESFVWKPDAGLRGGAMRCRFEKGQVSAGSLKVLFGQNPFGRGLRTDETFRDIYWRVYVKHEPGWEGNPAKLARATCLAGNDWSQGLIAHVWGGKGDALCIDPATGIHSSQKVTTKYNDFPNLKWLPESALGSNRWMQVPRIGCGFAKWASRTGRLGTCPSGDRQVGCDFRSASWHPAVVPRSVTTDERAADDSAAPYVSKSKFLWGLQCPKLLWHAYNRKDLIPEPDAALQAVFDQGHEVGALAKRLPLDGVEITASATDLDETVQLPQRALRLHWPVSNRTGGIRARHGASSTGL